MKTKNAKKSKTYQKVGNRNKPPSKQKQDCKGTKCNQLSDALRKNMKMSVGERHVF